MYDDTIETFEFGPKDRVRVIYDENATNPAEDLVESGLSLHALYVGNHYTPLPSGADSQADVISEYVENDDPAGLTAHFEEMGLSVITVEFYQQRDFVGKYLAYGEDTEITEAYITGDLGTIDDYLNGSVYALVHEKLVTYRNVEDDGDIHHEWKHESQVGGFYTTDYGMAGLRYDAIAHFALPTD